MSVNRPVFNFGASKCESDNADCIRIFSTSSKLRDLYAKKSNWNDDIFDKPRCCDFQNMKMSNRLQKRPSAPELTLRSLLKNPQGEKLSEAEMKNHFEPNGINFQQRANQQPNSDLLGGNFAQMSTFRPDKRHSIICGRDLILSMRSIVDEFRGSCSTPMANVSFPSAYSEECSLPSTLGFSGCLHSEPQTYGSANIVNALTSHSGGSDLTFHSVAIKLEEQAFFQRDSNNLDDFEPRPMTPTTLGIDGCNVDISPIGDGTTEGLNVMLQTFRVSQYNDIEDDLFAPIPL